MQPNTPPVMKLAEEERRREARDTRPDHVSLTVLEGPAAGRSFELTARDQSFSGVSFGMTEPLYLGQHCRITVHHADETCARFIAKVVRCLPLENGVFEVAVQFKRQIAA